MKQDRMRRFSWGEIILHWVNAGVYLTLVVTGALLLGGRWLDIRRLPYSALRHIHRTCGLVLVGLLGVFFILSLFVPTFREIWRTLRHCLAWCIRDIVWLFKVPVNMVFARCALPPADRFNPGQKLHLLVVFTALTGLSASGMSMMAVPGALGPWIVHVTCFAAAGAFLGLHLFLSLVNPETRKALPGIFTGWVDMEYARAHHALWVRDDGLSLHGSYVSWKAVSGAGLLGITAVVLTLGRLGPDRLDHRMERTVVTRGMIMLQPGPLHPVHAAQTELADCRACHGFWDEPASADCLDCHEVIAGRRAAGLGYHATFTQVCRDCHKEHGGTDPPLVDFDQETFDHNQAVYPLKGRHRPLACLSCHAAQSRTIQYIGIDHASCRSCHDDPHQGRLGAACSTCHQETGFTGEHLIFNHNTQTPFKLDAAHHPLACTQCHSNENDLFEAAGTLCQDCHVVQARGMAGESSTVQEAPDYHYQRLQCNDCHDLTVTDQSLDSFAGRCAGCHTDHYRTLLAKWGTLLQQRHDAIRQALPAQPVGKDIQDRLDEAEAIGTHHIRLSRELLDSLLHELQKDR